MLFSTNSCAGVNLIKCGTEWINMHKGNVNLIGIHVQQYPDNLQDRSDYKDKHPAMIIYIFKDNRAHTVTYTPTGQIENGIWWNIPDKHWARDSLAKDMKTEVECAYWK